ncbi:MAG: hypothetical protein N4A50_05045 [Vallitalea sp.]|jgi:ferredoxin|nr:hypothetical protein [Vallitalea sp.]
MYISRTKCFKEVLEKELVDRERVAGETTDWYWLRTPETASGNKVRCVSDEGISSVNYVEHSFIAITTKGLFQPCSHLKIKEKANSIYEYYTQTEFKTIHRCNEKSICSSCLYEVECGGCRAISEYIKEFSYENKGCPVYEHK